ncbi:xanthine dehydrogenase [Marinomonas ushuaiensis DSM 15871]|uniref:Xanthine dehydrogenase n=1 Tax=Marinomonas ushuaiensis DSM 15871 TaxID=1122207 RepID=X7E8B1_9GAMM|nr:xanthine dehydrogenase small subunit [Marinomonas ushuaiensis]ETX11391.1 xanthine dehydrogenase [Marinomonas ushuaiensis DSM 15871]
MKFVLNDKLIEDNTLPSDFTALRYLREKLGLTGTKEGCASGDCGACTLLVGALEGGELKYTTLNSCITPIQSLSGKHVVSVEYLSDAKKGALHPAQQTMVDCHGSQCGFCTPGIVLSLASLYEYSQTAETEIDREAVCDAISGNLCRCTGYRPIIDAGLSMQKTAMQKKDMQGAAIADEPYVELMSKNSDVKAKLESLRTEVQPATNYLQPQNLAELAQAKSQYPDATLIAGGTDLMLENTQRFHDFGTLIDLSQVTEMQGIQDDGVALTIGASTTYSELEDFSKSRYPHIYTLLSRIASRQIRNRGTIGGNVANASPIADLPPLLLALNSDMTLASVDGTTRVVNINDFYQGYKTTVLAEREWIASFAIDLTTLANFHRFYKVSKRMEDDISSVMLAVRFETQGDNISDVRFAFGGMAATPIRALKAEAALTNVAIADEQALTKAIECLRNELSPMSDMRASSKYRLDMACNLVKKAWLELNGTNVPSFSGHPVSDELMTLGYEIKSKGESAHA